MCQDIWGSNAAQLFRLRFNQARSRELILWLSEVRKLVAHGALEYWSVA